MVINRSIEKQKWKFERMLGMSSFALALVVVLILFISGKSTTAQAGAAAVQIIAAPASTLVQPADTLLRPGIAAKVENEAMSDTALKVIPTISLLESIPVTLSHNQPASADGVFRNPEVILSEKQASIVRAFGDYMEARGDYAIVTSGTRTGESQLGIIKQRIEEHGASAKFPALQLATLADTKIWMKAWNWLRQRKVPVNAPAAVPGARVSQHLAGKAIDFIGSDLKKLRSQLEDFARSSYARASQVKVAGILQEPGCVHISITS